jgi:hypothetical protein
MKLRVFRVVPTILVLALTALASLACDTSQEGDRCNPLLAHNECNAGLVCGIPRNCDPTQPVHSPYANGEAYCCPANGVSTNPNCDGTCNPCAYAPSGVSAPAWCQDGGVPSPALDAEVD